MTTKTRTLTAGLANILIQRKYAELGYVPCRQCEQEIKQDRRIVIREANRGGHGSVHYHYICARRIALI